MNRRLLATLAAIVVALAGVWFFGLRTRGKQPSAISATGPGGAAAGSARDRRDGPTPPRGDDGEPAILFDDDPAGILRLEGLVLDAAEKPVAAATVIVSSNPRRQTTTDENGGSRSTSWSAAATR